jgi:hypothetical protein
VRWPVRALSARRSGSRLSGMLPRDDTARLGFADLVGPGSSSAVDVCFRLPVSQWRRASAAVRWASSGRVLVAAASRSSSWFTPVDTTAWQPVRPALISAREAFGAVAEALASRLRDPLCVGRPQDASPRSSRRCTPDRDRPKSDGAQCGCSSRGGVWELVENARSSQDSRPRARGRRPISWVGFPHSFPSAAERARGRRSDLTSISVVAQEARTVRQPPREGSP